MQSRFTTACGKPAVFLTFAAFWLVSASPPAEAITVRYRAKVRVVVKTDKPKASIPDPVQAVTQVVDSAGKKVGKISGDLTREAGVGLHNVARETGKGFGNLETTLRKAGKDSAAELDRTGNNLEDAVVAIVKFSENQLKGTGDLVSEAEVRFREGKIVDAMYHLAVDPVFKTSDHAALAATESSILNTVGSVAASVYGGPQGAAAYAAWLTYQQTKNADLALRIGIISGASSWAVGKASKIPGTDLEDSLVRAATVAAVSGLAVAASGGTPEDLRRTMILSGGAILVQDGYRAYVNRDMAQELKPATEKPMCMAAAPGSQACGPKAYMKDKNGYEIRVDENGNYQHADVNGKWPPGSERWRYVGDASSTPPGTPVVGMQTDKLPGGALTEAGAGMKAVAKIPGMNAMALFHDRWAVSWEMGSLAEKVSIAPAVVLTYVGAVAIADQYSVAKLVDAAVDAEKEKAAGAATAPKQLETALCKSTSNDLRVISVALGKQPDELRCVVLDQGKESSSIPWLAKSDPGFCSKKVYEFIGDLTNKGWSCSAR